MSAEIARPFADAPLNGALAENVSGESGGGGTCGFLSHVRKEGASG